MTMEFECRTLLRPRPQWMPGPPGSPFGREIHRYPGIAPLLYASWVALALIAGCSAKEDKPAPPPLGVTIAPVVQKDVPTHQDWVATMVINVDAEIRPKVEGFLLTRLYTEGSYVEKGQPMFQVDKRQAQVAVEQATGNLERARAALNQAQIDVRRFTPLVAQRAVSQAELDKASSERAASATVDADQAALDNAKLNLGWTTVISPISGIAGVAKVGIGDLITPATVMTTVSTVDPIHVDINIGEEDYMRFQRNKPSQSKQQNLELILGDGTVYPHRGSVRFVNREGDLRTGNSVETYRESVRLSSIRYDSGLASYLEIIDAQIQMYPAERSSSIYDLGRKQALVNLYRALGGGWNLNDSRWTSTSGASAPAQSLTP